MKNPSYEFLLKTGRILNASESSTILLTGNIHDYFFDVKKENYVPLDVYLKSSMKLANNMVVSYKITSGISFQNANDEKKFKAAWEYWKYEFQKEENFSARCKKTKGNPTYALELLRQMCICSNARDENDNPILDKKILIIMESVDSIIPMNAQSNLNDSDRIRIQICMDWFKDPEFLESEDAVILITESKSFINQTIARLPHLVEIQVPSPDADKRLHFIEWYNAQQSKTEKVKLRSKKKELVENTAGLTILALRRLLKNASYDNGQINSEDVLAEIKHFIERELGDIVEFKVPGHNLSDVVGCTKIKSYAKKKVVPRFKSIKKDSLPGATICGPIGGGKTFFWEAVAAESGMIVLVLSRLRDKWFGESDVRLERLKRILYAFVNVLIFIDEADAQFGSLSGEGQHATEKRLQAGILGMMSDPKLRGKVKWLLLTARIDRLSHDMLRPGRPGSLVIPMLDPEGDDRDEFLRWAVQPVLGKKINPETFKKLSQLTEGYFAAMYAELKSELIAEAKGKGLTEQQVIAVIKDIIHPAVNHTREYQSLCAKLFCNRRSLLPQGDKIQWEHELKELQMKHSL